VFCGGTPCQAFSVAGLRKSLDDARGNLSLTFVGIANAIDHVRSVRRDDPSIIFWENVPGVLSTKDNAFGCFLGALAGEDDPIIPSGDKWTNAGCVYGPQRAVAWRVLDAQYFGVAQRRRRVFVVASARADFDPAAVLFEFDGVRRDSAPSRETGKNAASCSPSSPEVCGALTARFGGQAMGAPEVDAGLYIPVSHSLRGEGFDASEDSTGRGSPLIPVAMRESGQGYWMQDDVAGTLRAEGEGRPSRPSHVIGVPIAFHPTQDPISSTDGTTHAMGCGSSGGTATVAVAQPLNIYGGNKRQDRPEGGFYVRMDEETSKTLDAASGLNPTCSQGGTAVLQAVGFDSYNHAVTGDLSKTLDVGQDYHHVPNVFQPIALQDVTPREKAQNGKGWNDDGSAYTVDTHATQGVMQAIPIDTMNMTPGHSSGGLGFGQPGDPSFTLTKGHSHAVAQPIAWDEEMNPFLDVAGTLLRGGAGGRHDGVMQPVGFTRCDHGGDAVIDGTPTMRCGSNYSAHLAAAMPSMQVRRLTPVECERLQGFPDNYTAIPWRKKPASECPDGPRYKALGNSWAVPVVRWIGARIQKEASGD
jgi:DNA (cytosine-5)-methyltransferase 1